MKHVRLDGERLVEVEFASPECAQRYFCWFKIGRLPREEVIPSVLWFSLKIGLLMVGALVFWKRPADRTASHFFLLCIVAVGAFMGGYHWAE